VAMPTDVGAVDLMIGFPSAKAGKRFDFLKPQLRDEESSTMATPIAYMFRDNPGQIDADIDPVAVTLGEMDRHGIAIGLVGLAGAVTDGANGLTVIATLAEPDLLSVGSLTEIDSESDPA